MSLLGLLLYVVIEKKTILTKYHFTSVPTVEFLVFIVFGCIKSNNSEKAAFREA